jgi:hypothetical protein
LVQAAADSGLLLLLLKGVSIPQRAADWHFFTAHVRSSQQLANQHQLNVAAVGAIWPDA